MTYKLKRDLPFAKAGAEVFTDDVGVYIMYEEKDYSEAVMLDYNLDLDGLIKDGWIEEVKPREWWIVDCSEPAWLFTKDQMEIKKENGCKFIKVREVI